MASNSKALAICDTCGFRYSHSVMKLNSFGLLVCPQDYEGSYDLKNHPQNKIPDVRDDPKIKNPRPDSGGRNLLWNTAQLLWEGDPNNMSSQVISPVWNSA
jgi:hypothetical protein|tara:strand:- start:1889 stop:2191 length:303 start_codon:yes stop_codon:yes gene_type:complete